MIWKVTNGTRSFTFHGDKTGARATCKKAFGDKGHVYRLQENPYDFANYKPLRMAQRPFDSEAASARIKKPFDILEEIYENSR